LVHSDLCGPILPMTLGGKKYFLRLVDDKSRFMWLALLADKSGTPAALKKLQMKVEVETGRRLCVLRTDNVGEFTSVKFEMYCTEQGVEVAHCVIHAIAKWHGRAEELVGGHHGQKLT
jgi:hypothetical protein